MDSCYSAYVFRLYPNAEQQKKLSYVFKAAKLIWNDLLAQEKERRENGDLPTPCDLLVAQARSYIEKEGFRDGDPAGYGEVGAILFRALKRHFEAPESYGHPKPRNVDSLPYSYVTRNYGRSLPYDGDCLQLPFLGKMKIRGLRPLPFGAEIMMIYIKQHKTGRFYATIQFRRRITPPRLHPEIAAKSIGLDYSPNRLFVSSDPRFQLPQGLLKAHRKTMKRFDNRMRSLSRSRRGSGRYTKKKMLLARTEAQIAFRRKDLIEKATHYLTKHYGIICIEDLSMKEMAKPTKNIKLGKWVHNSSWALFVNRLEQKANLTGNKIVKVGRYFPSSQICSACGAIKKVTLDERTYECPSCGMVMNRDLNAAVNIWREGLRIASNKQSPRGNRRR